MTLQTTQTSPIPPMNFSPLPELLQVRRRRRVRRGRLGLRRGLQGLRQEWVPSPPCSPPEQFFDSQNCKLAAFRIASFGASGMQAASTNGKRMNRDKFKFRMVPNGLFICFIMFHHVIRFGGLLKVGLQYSILSMSTTCEEGGSYLSHEQGPIGHRV